MKALSKRYVLSLLLKLDSDGANFISRGIEFHSRGAAFENALEPYFSDLLSRLNKFFVIHRAKVASRYITINKIRDVFGD